MASYCFKKADGTNEDLSLVDEELCKAFGLQSNKDRFSWAYDDAVEVGFGVLMKSGGFNITPETFDEWVEAVRSKATEGQLATLATLKPFLSGGKYTFEGWR